MDSVLLKIKDGITSLQMDKITSITSDIMKEALSQAKDGRIHILGEMAKAIEKPKEKILIMHLQSLHSMFIKIK